MNDEFVKKLMHIISDVIDVLKSNDIECPIYKSWSDCLFPHVNMRKIFREVNPQLKKYGKLHLERGDDILLLGKKIGTLQSRYNKILRDERLKGTRHSLFND